MFTTVPARLMTAAPAHWADGPVCQVSAEDTRQIQYFITGDMGVPAL